MYLGFDKGLVVSIAGSASKRWRWCELDVFYCVDVSMCQIFRFGHVDSRSEPKMRDAFRHKLHFRFTFACNFSRESMTLSTQLALFQLLFFSRFGSTLCRSNAILSVESLNRHFIANDYIFSV